jgi:hypothetical protein
MLMSFFFRSASSFVLFFILHAPLPLFIRKSFSFHYLFNEIEMGSYLIYEFTFLMEAVLSYLNDSYLGASNLN